MPQTNFIHAGAKPHTKRRLQTMAPEISISKNMKTSPSELKDSVYDVSQYISGCRDETYDMDESSRESSACEGANKEASCESHHFLERMYSLMLEKARSNVKRDSHVLRFTEPEKLAKLIDIEIGADAVSDDELMKLVRNVCDHCVNTSHPHFFNQLFAGSDEYAIAGSALTDVFNSSSYTFEMAPVFSIQERYLFNKMISYIGWENGEAIFCPGGSLSNMYALNCARHKKFPTIKQTGMHGHPPLIVFTSEHCHYSIKKGMSFLGLGSDNLVKIKVDSRGRMIPDDLEIAIQKCLSESKCPLLVNATCGTTVLGAFDPVNEIADVCEKYSIWLHMDGAWGGSVLLSKTHRHLMTGSHRADSMTWNAHKMLSVPQQCSAFFTRHENLLRETFSANASYLFQQDKFYDVSYDTGDASLQCGRKVDVFKFWLMWKKIGDKGIEERVDKAFRNAEYLTEKIRKTEGFQLVFEPQFTNVGFWYIPPNLRGRENDPDFLNRLSEVAPKIKERMMREGTTMINYQPCGELVNFFRMIVINPTLTEQDMDFVLNEVQRLGEDL